LVFKHSGNRFYGGSREGRSFHEKNMGSHQVKKSRKKKHDREVIRLTFSREWRDLTISQLSKLFPSWIIYGEPWLSWLWIDCKSEEVVKKVIETAKKGKKEKNVAKKWTINRLFLTKLLL
jgi:hypothetical protein